MIDVLDYANVLIRKCPGYSNAKIIEHLQDGGYPAISFGGRFDLIKHITYEMRVFLREQFGDRGWVVIETREINTAGMSKLLFLNDEQHVTAFYLKFH